MKTIDAIIIGGGLFGQVITKALLEQKRIAIMIDNKEPEAGSKPAACIMKPSWFSSLGKTVYEPALELLDRLYGVQDVEFLSHPAPWVKSQKPKMVTAHWIPPNKILSGRSIPETVTKITLHPPKVWFRNGEFLEAKLIVVAAGIWTEKLLPFYRQTGQKGISFLWEYRTLKQAQLWHYAPYKQFMAFNRGDGLWAGDGTAIKPENWSLSREEVSQNRAMKRLGFVDVLPRSLVGIRPYAKTEGPCVLHEVGRGLWVASGGAKNGTVAAGYCAHIIGEATQ